MWDTNARKCCRRSAERRLSILSDKDEYGNGEPIEITATVKNVSDGPTLIFAGATISLFYKTTVKAPVPEWMHWAPEAPEKMWMDGGGNGWRPLKAGEEISETINLTKRYDMTKPGKYRVTFSRDTTVSRGASRYHLVSNEITVTVLPKQP